MVNMESRSLLNPRQLMTKGKQLDRQADRSTRAFVALQNRKMSRRSGVEKKRRIPVDISNIDENEVQNGQDQNRTEKNLENAKSVDPIKEALKKWQKDKRLLQIQEKKKKKAPFCVSSVSYQVSEYTHSYRNAKDDLVVTKLRQKVVPPPPQCEEKNTEAMRKNKPSNSATGKKTGTKTNKQLTRPRTMKTRSMAKTTPVIEKTSKLATPVAMETDEIQATTCRRELSSCMTRTCVQNETTEDRTTAIPNKSLFNVPVGVESFLFCGDKFQFKPLSPNSAKKFFPTGSLEAPDEMEPTFPAEHSDKKNVVGLLGGVLQVASEEDIAMNDIRAKEESKKNELDLTYFRNLANSEIERLKSRCTHWENEDEEMIPEEVKGMLRTVIGQVQLLVTKKFKQFAGLLDLSENPTAEKKALVSDLQGFWDMMYIQVEDIDRKFEELQQLKENNWQTKKTEVADIKKKRTAKAKKTSKTSNAKVLESRNKFREMRAQMKAKLQEEKSEEQDAFRIILTPMKNKKADADPSEPEIILTPVRRSTRKSRGPSANFSIPVSLVNFQNVTVDLFGACRTPEAVQSNVCLLNLEDSILRPRRATPAAKVSASDDLMAFSPSTPFK